MYTDKQFFEIEINGGIHAGNRAYCNLMRRTAKEISGYGPKSVLEIGSGMGLLIKELSELGINATGIEPNPYHVGYAHHLGVKLVHPWEKYSKSVDMLVSVEVFEHLTDEQIDDYLSSISCGRFLFSSTPNFNDTQHELDWGHINVKHEYEWIKLFCKYGYYLERKVDIPTKWSLMFVK